MEFGRLFPKKPIVGMVHMPALPGASDNRLTMDELTEFALSEASKLEEAGLDACIIENVGIEYAAQDLAERGGADAVIVSGPRSPVPPTFEKVKKVRDAIKKPVLIGSGISLANVKEFYRRSDGIIIGEPDFKVGGVWGGPSDERAYARAVRACRPITP